MVLVLLTSLNCYMSTLHLVHYTLLLTPTYWKSNDTNARLMAFAPSLALDPTNGIHSHKTLDTVQPCHLLNPNWKPSSSHSIFIPINISTKFLLQSCVCSVCFNVCVCVDLSCVMCHVMWISVASCVLSCGSQLHRVSCHVDLISIRCLVMWISVSSGVLWCGSWFHHLSCHVDLSRTRGLVMWILVPSGVLSCGSQFHQVSCLTVLRSIRCFVMWISISSGV